MEPQVPSNTWARILNKLETKVSPQSFKTWFGPTSFLEEDATSVSVRVPNTWFAEWLRSNYLGVIRDALRETDQPDLAVEFRPDDEPSRETPAGTPTQGSFHDFNGDPPADADAASPRRSPDGRILRSAARTTRRNSVRADENEDPLPRDSTSKVSTAGYRVRSSLNPRYTFETFVVSSCNQFAHAAAMAVVEQPMRAYNPLYIYGGVGLGKTHLMQAIGNQIGGVGGMRMRYISSERFMNDLINAIRFEKTLEFKEGYRNVDLLLIDDIQFLAGKERTQEEFFHTFNALHDAQKQIVITSDVTPRDIPTLEDRLRSRFEWGLIADIQPPDLETKIAILRKKAEAEGAVLPDDVTLFVASNCSSNIRELEGALIRVIAYASVAKERITLDLARETLRGLMPSESPAATTESIQKHISNYYNLRVSQLKAKTNSHQISFPRQIAMYLCKQLTDSPLQEIGRRFGGKHHSTVIHAVQKIERKRQTEKEFDKLIEHFMQSLK